MVGHWQKWPLAKMPASKNGHQQKYLLAKMIKSQTPPTDVGQIWQIETKMVKTNL